jgi:ubiquinone/menaquinone biosynthesis C-methylase UbiE
VSDPNEPSRTLAAQYSIAAAAYARHWAPVIGPMARPLFAELHDAAARSVLDLGCGTGEHLANLRGTFPNAFVCGVDRSEGMVRIARQSAQCQVALMDAAQLALVSGGFDAAVIVFVLFHLPEPLRGLRETLRVLRAGGVAGIVTWGKCPDVPGIAIWKEELDAQGAGSDPRPTSAVQDELMDTPEKLSALLEEAGFVSPRVWSGAFAHRWTAENLMQLQLGFGSAARRAATLSESARTSCRSRVEARLARLSVEELTHRPKVLYAIARRPAST